MKENIAVNVIALYYFSNILMFVFKKLIKIFLAVLMLRCKFDRQKEAKTIKITSNLPA